MSNGLVDLMQLYAEQNAKNDNSIKCVAGKIVAVTDDMFRADIELGQGQVVKDMMNKSGEKLKVGDTVWIEYFTYPSSGWIARRNGEPDPMGGGGASTIIDTATVLTDENFHDFVIEEELMVDVVPPNRVYYGAHPSFCIVQGHYCALAYGYSVSYDSETGEWSIDGSTELYDRIIQNKDKFGSQIGCQVGGGWLNGQSPSVAYPSQYTYLSCEPYSLTFGSSGIAMQVAMRRWQANTIAPSGNWWEEDMTWGTATESALGTSDHFRLTSPVGNNTWQSEPTDIFIVPCVNFTNTTKTQSFEHPYGYVNISSYLIFASNDGVHYGVSRYTGSQALVSLLRVPLISEAENAFTLGISKRSEPIIDGGGG